MNKKISIIVPLFNTAKYMDKCIETIKKQTYKDIEVILIDDGSEDDTWNKCEAYAREDARFIALHQEHKGVSAARNAGLDAATGAYVGFVDADDWCTFDMYEYLMRGLEEADADVSCCRYYRVIPGKPTTSRCDGSLEVMTGKEAMLDMLDRFVIRDIMWNKLYKKTLFDGIRFPEGRISEGTVVTHRVLLRSEQVVLLGDPKYYNFKRSDSCLEEPTVQGRLDCVMMQIQRYHELVPQFPECEQELTGKVVKKSMELEHVFQRFSREEQLSTRYLPDFIAMMDFLEDKYLYIMDHVLEKAKDRKRFKNFIEQKLTRQEVPNNPAAITVKDVHISYQWVKSSSIKTMIGSKKKKKEVVHAVRGVSFEVMQGSIMGIIGKNGSGKSTMLKAIAGIFSADSGEMNLHGHSVSLLSIGVGFKKELTGRENIMLSGMLMGYEEDKVREHMDAIIEFSELGKFVDMPVRTYSSGMYSKLAFSISAILETDILLIDEVFSVGDQRFKQKSYKKMRSLIENDDRTVVIVSHNINTLRTLCTEVMWMHEGEIVKIGDPNHILDEYEEFMAQ